MLSLKREGRETNFEVPEVGWLSISTVFHLPFAQGSRTGEGTQRTLLTCNLGGSMRHGR